MKTKWYSFLQSPIHVGWYERDYVMGGKHEVHRDWWDGVHWRYSPNGEKCYVQWRAWRGQNK